MLALTLLAAHTVSFGFFGCNRVDSSDLDPVRNPSSANKTQLRLNLEEAAAARVDLLFAGGDIVNGYADDDGTLLATQLRGWTGEVAPFRPKLRVVPIAGNHELNKKVGDQRKASLLTYPRWLTWLKEGRYIAGKNGPTPAKFPQDALALDESRMSYTLDRAGVRFIVLNTDTRTTTADPFTDTTLGWIPVAWATRELERAESDPRVKAVFVLGHRNLIDPSQGKGDAPIDPKAAEGLVKAMAGKQKLRAYVCAHVHMWNVRPIPGTTALQIIAGDGGSKLEKGATEEFGWVELRVHPDGSAGYIHHHRPMPHPYNAPVPTPTVADPEVPIALP